MVKPVDVLYRDVSSAS